jgi:hypothetical protein
VNVNKQHLPPRLVVVDLVLQYSAGMPKTGTAAVLQGSLLLAAKNHLGQAVAFGIPVHFDDDPFDGDATTPPRFVLRRIGATVWKLAPSIKHDLLHAFITIVDVPPAVAWVPVTDAQIRALFARHCECRPVATARLTHSHDCNTGYTDVCREALHGQDDAARKRVAEFINQEAASEPNEGAAPRPFTVLVSKESDS